MNSGPSLFLGLFLAMIISWFAFVLGPQLQIGNLQQESTVADLPTLYPRGLPGQAHKGEKLYRANGCAACHTQQVRPATRGSDIARHWGARRSVAEDYLYDQPVMLGSLRIGPDLANAGLRMDANAVLVRLFNPRALPGNRASIMPPYPYLFEKRKIRGAPSPDALQLPPQFAPEPGYEVIPSPDALALAAYVANLRQDSYLFEVPPPEVKTNAPGTNAPGAKASQTNLPTTVPAQPQMLSGQKPGAQPGGATNTVVK
jgi:cytochrome c oxidase cbb3-type subunit 2